MFYVYVICIYAYWYIKIPENRIDLGSPSGAEVISNPTAVHDSNNLTKVFCLCGNGQVYSIQQDPQKTTAFGKWIVISSVLPVDKGMLDTYNLHFQ
jgi:hypothetical protein